jgi:hypothetical protein
MIDTPVKLTTRINVRGIHQFLGFMRNCRKPLFVFMVQGSLG